MQSPARKSKREKSAQKRSNETSASRSALARISERLFSPGALSDVAARLDAGADANLAVPLSARPLVVAALFARMKRPLLVCVAGEEAAARFAYDVKNFIGDEQRKAGDRQRATGDEQGRIGDGSDDQDELVVQLPLRRDLPWIPTGLDPREAGVRTRAIRSLVKGEPRVVVASARSLLRLMPSPAKAAALPLKFVTGQQLPCDYSELANILVQMGYNREDKVVNPGGFSLRGDLLDVFDPTGNHPVRIEIFAEEVDSIRIILAATGQTISSVAVLELAPIREFTIGPEAVRRLRRKVEMTSDLSSLPATVAHHLDLLAEGNLFDGVDRYLPYLYDDLGTVLTWMDSRTLVVLAEPRTLFDDAAVYFDALQQSATRQEAGTEGLFSEPGRLDFGSQQRLTLLSLLSSGTRLDGRLQTKHPDITGSNDRLIQKTRSLLSEGYLSFIAQADVRVRKELALDLSDAAIPFDLTLTPDAQTAHDADIDGGTMRKANRNKAGEKSSVSPAASCGLSRHYAHFVDWDLPAPLVFPQAKLALLTLSDKQGRNAAAHAAHAARLRSGHPNSSADVGANRSSLRTAADPTSYTFAFKPGDYVVHATHGIALFKQIVRREVDGVWRDYLHLEYARGDKLFSPVELIDKVSRYVGAQGTAPRLTRLNTADWSRAYGKARKAARKLAFDLVDLYARRSSARGFAFGPDTAEQRAMEQRFAYVETSDQLTAIDDVKADMRSPRPMDRLICGDVGFGKTEVALRAAFKAVQDGKQVLALTPTTILAQQHYTTFAERFEPFAVRVEVLSRFKTAAQQRRILEAVANGNVDVLIGTHRLLSADVNPKDLGLIIIDEEQRFGVQHKEQLKNLREQLDVLALSATPIPRTLQMALSGVRDMSLINTPPPARSPIKVHVGEWDEDLVSAAIRRELARHGQVYYVSNRVKSIDEAVRRVQYVAPEARIAVAHGQMSEQQLERVMERFAANEVDVLVATTIIESGLDNPHTNTLIIEDSQRLGLAQLYQLKGRVGRSHEKAYAYFLFPSAHRLTEEAVERLTAIEEYQELGSGIRVAMRDLELRGAGSLLGAEQHGNLTAVGFDLFASMLAEAVEAARYGEVADLAGEKNTTAAVSGTAGVLGSTAGVTGAAGTVGTAAAGSGENALSPANADVRIDVPVHAYLPEEYLPAVDERVLYYRRIAAAGSLQRLDDIAERLEQTYGGLPAPSVNLLDRARAKVLAAALGISSIALTQGKLDIRGLALTSEQVANLKSHGATYLVKSQKLLFPVQSDVPPLPVLLGLLEQLLQPLLDTPLQSE
ncbi:MAG: transcription-repair coupling factor [Coriobacteriales bacterium]|jgi:transcription-repair coupling factor (superfamily II helicase)|nr:transcription-repair coupling factor [Coriobacteriales bacterium]